MKNKRKNKSIRNPFLPLAKKKKAGEIKSKKRKKEKEIAEKDIAEKDIAEKDIIDETSNCGLFAIFPFLNIT